MYTYRNSETGETVTLAKPSWREKKRKLGNWKRVTDAEPEVGDEANSEGDAADSGSDEQTPDAES